MSRRAAPYQTALDWLLTEDDCTWLDAAEPIPSVTACLVADLYSRDLEEVLSDLLKRRAIRFPATYGGRSHV